MQERNRSKVARFEDCEWYISTAPFLGANMGFFREILQVFFKKILKFVQKKVTFAPAFEKSIHNYL